MRRLSTHANMSRSGVSRDVVTDNRRMDVSTPFNRSSSGSVTSIVSDKSSDHASGRISRRDVTRRLGRILGGYLGRERHGVMYTYFNVSRARGNLRRVKSGVKLAHREIQRVERGDVAGLERSNGVNVLVGCLKWEWVF